MLQETDVRLQDTLAFSGHLHRVLHAVCGLFKSKQQTDVSEAIEFVVTCAEFRVADSPRAVRRLCALIWQKEAAVREKVCAAFKRLYLDAEMEAPLGYDAQRTESDHAVLLTGLSRFC